MRSEGQFNTIIYEETDSYRQKAGRDAIFLNRDDMATFGVGEGQAVTLKSAQGEMRGKVVAWETANRFKLDNGQLWEGLEPIPYELVGKNVEITARPAGRFQLMVEGRNTTLRVIRLR